LALSLDFSIANVALPWIGASLGFPGFRESSCALSRIEQGLLQNLTIEGHSV
jgi:hypothetical protein